MNFHHLLSSLILSASLLALISAQNDDDEYSDPGTRWDPTHRDFSQRCLRLAEYAGPRGCDVFLVCCSEENVLNKLNGDKCQVADIRNGCTPKEDNSGIQSATCRARNCTPEITTTTTTTLSPRRNLNSASLASVTCNFSNAMQIFIGSPRFVIGKFYGCHQADLPP